jgi:hypothetical protein
MPGLLQITRDMGIELVFPDSQLGATVDDQEIPPGTVRFTDAFAVSQPAGEWTTIAVVTTRPVDFSHFAQPDLPRTQMTGQGVRKSRIDELTNDELFLHRPVKTGLSPIRMPDDESYLDRVLRWSASN